MDGSSFETQHAPAPSAGAMSFDLNIAIATFRRRLRLFAAIALAVFVAVLLYTLQETPRYTATSQVMLDVRKEQVTDMSAVLSGLPADSSVVDTEVEVLKSRSLAARVVKQLKLDQDPLLQPERGQAPRALRRGCLGSRRPSRRWPPSDRSRPSARSEKVVDNLLEGLKVRRSGLTYLISVEYTHTDPAEAAKVANAFADQYLTDQLDAKFNANRQANQWLAKKVGEMAIEVQSAEAEVQQYKIANNLMSSQGTTLVEQEISTLEQQRATAKTEQAEAEARLNIARQQMASGSTGEDVGETLTSPVVQQLRQQRAALSARVADLQGRYGPRHPDMLKAQRELQDVDAQINAEIKRIISNLDAQARVARQRTGSIVGTVGSARGNLAANNRAGVRLAELERKAESVRTLYESLSGPLQADERPARASSIPTPAWSRAPRSRPRPATPSLAEPGPGLCAGPRRRRSRPSPWPRS
jgi:succinoglycan biosynthesis transport protein ExoP